MDQKFPSKSKDEANFYWNSRIKKLSLEIMFERTFIKDQALKIHGLKSFHRILIFMKNFH